MVVVEAKILWIQWEIVGFYVNFLSPMDMNIGASLCKEGDLSYIEDTNWQWLSPTFIRLQ